MTKATEDAVMEVGLRLLGPARLVTLFGYAVLLGRVAPEGAGRSWIIEHGPMSRPTRYRRVAELEMLLRGLEDAGYDVESVDVGDGRLASALRRVAA